MAHVYYKLQLEYVWYASVDVVILLLKMFIPVTTTTGRSQSSYSEGRTTKT